MSDEPVIGIDLGTTYSVVSMYESNNPKVIQDELGNKIIPSFIAFENEDKVLVGDMAKSKLGEKGIAVIYDAKRLIGRTCDDPNVMRDKQNWPFRIIPDNNNKPIIVVDAKLNRDKYSEEELKDFTKIKKKITYIDDLDPKYREMKAVIPLPQYSDKHPIPTVEKKLTPEEVSSYVLKKLKDMAEAELGRKVKKAVITVPAYFNNSQRESTKIAGELAGLEVLRIINEPTAAALAYGLNETNDNQDKKILVFDLGGGTFDVTILSLEYDDEKIFEVKSTDGNTHLGGQDFDQELFKLANEKFACENNGSDLEGSATGKTRVKKACEKAKIILSDKDQTTIKLEKVYLGSDLEITFTREQFEELCKPYFDKCLVTVDNALKLAKVKESDIKYIVLIGGSTRIPYIRNMLKNKFKYSKLCFNINPDETVSIGAAIQGAIITQRNDTTIRDVNLFDVTPLSLGIEVIGERMDINIDRNSPTPITRTKIYQTAKDNQTTVAINIYEGENQNIKNNHLIGKFYLKNLPKLPAGQAKVEVTFFVDENNILNVSAKDVSNEQNQNEITIINDTGIINEEEKKKIKQNISKYDEYEKKNQINLLKTRSLKNDMIKFREKIQNSNDNQTKYKYHKLLCQSFETFMESFDLKSIGKNEAYLSKFKIYLTYLIKEYGSILSYGNLVDEEVINNIRKNLFKYVTVLIQLSRVTVYELLEDLNINRKINDFCCIFRISENYTQGILLNNNKEIKEAGKCFTNILQEAANHDLETQLSFIDSNSQDKIRKYVSDAQSYLHNFYIQNTIDEGDKLFQSAVKNNKILDLNKLRQSLDLYNYAIQLNKIEKKDGNDEIIDNYKYDLCVYKINEILIHNLGTKNEKMKKLLEQLQKNLKLRNEVFEKEKKQIEDIKKKDKKLKDEKSNLIKNDNPNLFKDLDNAMKNINNDIKKTAKEFIKLILREAPYPGYNNEFDDKYIDNLFKQENSKIKKFIKKLKIKYLPDKFNKIKEQLEIARQITAHLNDIFQRIED